jgi:ribosomal protein S18 acetylase RimI-like enzyme
VGAAAAEINVRTARSSEINACIPFLVSGTGRPAPDAVVQQFRHFATLRSVRLDRMLVAQAGDRIVWYALPIASPGRTVMFMLPGAPPPPPELAHAADMVMIAACAAARADGAHLAQVLLDPSDNLNRAMLARHRFTDLAELIYLQTNPRAAAEMPPVPIGFTIIRYSPETHDLFATAIVQSYKDSLDCPGLAGLRGIEDIILGHKAAGDFNPDTWFVLLENAAPVGVLLLSTVTGHDTTELVYIGLSPSARRRGLARYLLQLALHVTRKNNNHRLTLAVDSKNTPALKLYYTHGFQRILAKLALIKDLRIA